VYFAFAALYLVLWIIALLLVPIFAWLVYGFWRIKQSRL
jgi:hypothetical protein